MTGNSFGTFFRITTWGESHGSGVGVVIDGCPAGLKISEKEIQRELDRRRPGQSRITTARKEADKVQILSGVFEGKTTGTPISLMVKNENGRSEDYKTVFRPGHADEAYFLKYGLWDYRGGGRASARETVGRVAAGAIAKKLIGKTEILAYVIQAGDLIADINPKQVTSTDIEKNIMRCLDQKTAKKMIAEIEEAKKAGKSLRGVIECVIRHAPAGLGSPVFNKLSARLAQGMMSIPAARGFEFNGGISGGISNGKEIILRITFKAPGTTGKRHDPCVLPRAVPIVEAMTALVLADEMLIQRTVRV
ncbi:MAG: chorismate synthase [Candidatus Peregrinibacteria bacterium]